MKRYRITENRLRNIIRESIDEVLNEGTSTIRDDYVYIIYDFKRECYDAAYGCDIFDDLRWNNVMLVGGPFVEWTDEVDRQVEQLQSREREEWDKYHVSDI